VRRVELVHGPTPIVARRALSDMLGVDLWIKRDDATGGAEAGNKVRKLEYLLGDAIEKRCPYVLTCGGTQSNHARATAIACAALGLRAVLFLRRGDGDAEDADLTAGNLLLDRLVGAEIRWITPAEYADRANVMEAAAAAIARTGERAYVIPEGGSNGLGSLGYVDAMEEVRVQLDIGLAGRTRFDVVAHACGSGGTAAGVALGARLHDVSDRTWAFAVCNDAGYFERTIARIIAEALALDVELLELPSGALVVDDRAKGPAYAVSTPEQREFLVEVARRSGVILDPVYTGKALFGLFRAIERGDIRRGARVLFVHTGGLPGLLAQGREVAQALE